MKINSALKYKLWLFVTIIVTYIYFPATSFSTNIEFSASVDKTHATTEDSIKLSIKVGGVRNPPKPELPLLLDFTVRSLGTSSSTQIINSNMKISTTYNYLLIPKKEGNFKISSIPIKLSGTIYKSNPITLIIKNLSNTKSKAIREVYTETSISKKNPYINEQIVYTFKLFRKKETRNLNLSMPYDENFFQKEALGKAKRYSIVINGIEYDVDEVSIGLFPLKTGKATVPPSMMELDLINRSQLNRQRDPFARFFDDSFFSGITKSNHKILSTRPIEVNIYPLPKEGKPSSFKNLVGKIHITATIGKKILEAGDTTTLTITVSGTGNIMNASITSLNTGNDFKVYPDQPIFKKSIHGNQVGGEKIFKFALVPLATGQKTIPSITLNYFDPEEKKYKEISTSPINIKIKSTTNPEHLSLFQPKTNSTRQNSSTISVLTKDILPIHTQMEDFERNILIQYKYIIFIIGILIPIAIYSLAGGYIRYNHQMNDDIPYSRRQVAQSNAIKKLNLLPTLNLESKDFVRELSQIIREYIGDKLNFQGTAFTSNEVEDKLNLNTLDRDKTSAVKILLEKCESMQYSPDITNKDDDLIAKTTELIKKLEKQL
jgi:hypothetical protein